MSFYFLHLQENTYEKNMKSLMVLALAVASFGTLSGSCCTQYPGGGVWTYGASNGGAFSITIMVQNIIVQL